MKNVSGQCTYITVNFDNEIGGNEEQGSLPMPVKINFSNIYCNNKGQISNIESSWNGNTK